MIKNIDLKRRIIEISWKHKLSHLGSCLTAVDIIKDIYDRKKPSDPFILSSGHAGIALYVVLESRKMGNTADDIYLHHGIHPDRCSQCGLFCSTGSLGQGLPIAVGMALADKERDVYCLISDGECAEGSIWESLKIIRRNRLKNVHIYVNWNNWAAYQVSDSFDIGLLRNFMHDELFEVDIQVSLTETDPSFLPFLKDQDAHYHVMTEEEYKQAIEILK